MKTKTSKPILPAAFRETEITKGDVAAVLRVVQNKKAPTGRYKRKPNRLPAVVPAAAKK